MIREAEFFCFRHRHVCQDGFSADDERHMTARSPDDIEDFPVKDDLAAVVDQIDDIIQHRKHLLRIIDEKPFPEKQIEPALKIIICRVRSHDTEIKIIADDGHQNSPPEDFPERIRTGVDRAGFAVSRFAEDQFPAERQHFKRRPVVFRFHMAVGIAVIQDPVTCPVDFRGDTRRDSVLAVIFRKCLKARFHDACDDFRIFCGQFRLIMDS